LAAVVCLVSLLRRFSPSCRSSFFFSCFWLSLSTDMQVLTLYSLLRVSLFQWSGGLQSFFCFVTRAPLRSHRLCLLFFPLMTPDRAEQDHFPVFPVRRVSCSPAFLDASSRRRGGAESRQGVLV